MTILINEDAEDEYERYQRIKSEILDGERTKEFCQLVSKYPYDFHGDLLHMVKTFDNDAQLGANVRLLVESWIEELAGEED